MHHYYAALVLSSSLFFLSVSWRSHTQHKVWYIAYPYKLGNKGNVIEQTFFIRYHHCEAFKYEKNKYRHSLFKIWLHIL